MKIKIKFKSVYKILYISLSIILIPILCFIGYLELAVSTVIEEDELEKIVAEIKASPALPALFYEVYEKYDLRVMNSEYDVVLGVLLQENPAQCPCSAYPYPFSYRMKKGAIQRIGPIILSLELEKRTSLRKCYEYMMQIKGFGRNIKDVSSACSVYFKKTPTELNEDEILALYFIDKAPTYYNPISNPENLEKALERLKNGR